MDAELENRFVYHAPTELRASQHGQVRAAGKWMCNEINELCPDGREKSLAITKIEEAIMWANAAIARDVTPEMTFEEVADLQPDPEFAIEG